MFDEIDTIRREVSNGLNASRRSQLGQFMTPTRIARFMASMFTPNEKTTISLLDAGAGVGSLTAAFLEHVHNEWSTIKEVYSTTYEIDATLFEVLKNNLSDFQSHASDHDMQFTSNIYQKDFIEQAVLQIHIGDIQSYDFAILNPPYKKINSKSSHRLLLRTVGIETVNLYTAFVALALLQMKPVGQIVAIIPRSFCNGPYYRPFRELVMRKAAIRQIHLFDSRNKPFGEDAVLQENIIIHLAKGEPQGQVIISTSTDDTFEDLKSTSFSFDEIIKADDIEKFIHIPTGHEEGGLKLPPSFKYNLSDIGIVASTGPVVDFRAKEYLYPQPVLGTVPLLYPGHFGMKYIEWPRPEFKKPNAIECNPKTIKSLYPSGFYTVVKRFSSKEEAKRIVARVVDPTKVPASHYGFENHLNVFHVGKQGLSEAMALGLAVYLNSTIVDQYFRQFNGHTQVNVTDLRLLKYPSRKVLTALGDWAKGLDKFEQVTVDKKVASVV